MAHKDLDEIRAMARRLAKRIGEDPEFKELVQANPQILLDEGLPEPAIADLLHGTDLLDVSGYLRCASLTSL